jgi:hypothetical protein
MQISLSKLLVVVTGVVALGMFGATGYLLYVVFFTGPQPDLTASVETVNAGVFGPKLQKAALSITDPAAKISLNKQKDLFFLDSALYKSFVDLPDVVPLSVSRGRPDPFVPYVAP